MAASGVARAAAPAAAGVFAELFRRSATSFPRLKGKVVTGTVVPSKPDDKFVEVDAGFKSTVTLLRAELGAAGATAAPGDVHPLVIEHVETPLGEMALDAEKARDAERLEYVWQEIKDTHARGGIVKARAACCGGVLLRRCAQAARFSRTHAHMPCAARRVSGRARVRFSLAALPAPALRCAACLARRGAC